MTVLNLNRLAVRCETAWERAAARPVTAVAVIIGLSLTCILTSAAVAGINEPQFHDELSQVVMADIFTHGRLCETPHKFWRHFETFHVLSQPCYQGKYPPGPAIFMAAGQFATGMPIAGVWLSVMVMIGAAAYALYAWLPARWALLGTWLWVLRFGIVGDWTQSYWGGTVAAAGGALVLGAAGRLRTNPRVLDGALLGAGLVVLALSRPYEGLAYSLPVLAAILWWLCRRGPIRRNLWLAGVPAAATVFLFGVGWMAYYNWRVTGLPSTMPYSLYEREYSAAPIFVWQAPRVPGPRLRHPEMLRFERDFVMANTTFARTHWPHRKLLDVASVLYIFLKPVLWLAGIGLLVSRRGLDTPRSLAVACLVAVMTASLIATWSATRYMAPATASLFLLATIGLAEISGRRYWRLSGRTVVMSIVLASVAVVPIAAARNAFQDRAGVGPLAKREIRESLLSSEGDDLVFVRYAPSHDGLFEWVYNGAELEQQPIVWAREIDPEADARLRAHFGKRNAWVVDADGAPPRLIPWQSKVSK